MTNADFVSCVKSHVPIEFTMLQAKYMRSVKSGTLHVYSVNGPKTELETYESIQGDNFKTDVKTGKAVWFTRKFCGSLTQLELRENSETGEEYYGPVFGEDFMIKMQIIKDSMSVSTLPSIDEKDDDEDEVEKPQPPKRGGRKKADLDN